MKIVHVTLGFGVGGIETMLVNIANGQSRLGHDVSIVVLNNVLDQALLSRLDKNVKFYCIGRNPQSKWPFPAIKLYFKVRSLDGDVIHLHYARLARFLPGKSMRSKMCVTLHDMCRPFNICSIDKAGKIFAISKMVKQDIKEKTGFDSTVVYNGVASSMFASRDYHKPQGTFRIVQLSRLDMEKKGQDILIKAVSKLIASGRRNIELTFIGDGDSRSELEKMVEDLALRDYVKFLGLQPQEYVFEHLKDYDLFVQPSRFDGFALTVAEAMVAKVPVLVCDNQAPVEVVDYGRHGYLFKGGDANACARAIAEIIDNYPTEEKVEADSQFARENYSVENTIKNYLRCYETQIINQ